MYRPPQDKQLEHLTRRFAERAAATKTPAEKPPGQQRNGATAWWVVGVALLTAAGIVVTTFGLSMSP